MIFRKSHVVLIGKLILVEVLLMSLYLVIRIPKSFILSPYLETSQNTFLNFLAIVYFLFLSVLELFLVLYVVLHWASEEYEVRDDSIIHRKGIFRLKEELITLRNLASTKISQGLMGKLCNYGTITLSSPLLKQDVYLIDVHDPRKIIISLEDNIETKETHSGTILRRRN